MSGAVDSGDIGALGGLARSVHRLGPELSRDAVKDSELKQGTVEELIRVVRRYGPEPLFRLALVIRDPASAKRLADTLELAISKVPPKATASAKARSKDSSVGTKMLNELRKSNPQMHPIVAEMRSYLVSGKVLPSMCDLREFSSLHNLSIGKASSRRAAIVPLLRSIAQRSEAEASELLRLMVGRRDDDRSLQAWRHVIVRSQRSAETPLEA